LRSMPRSALVDRPEASTRSCNRCRSKPFDLTVEELDPAARSRLLRPRVVVPAGRVVDDRELDLDAYVGGPRRIASFAPHSARWTIGGAPGAASSRRCTAAQGSTPAVHGYRETSPTDARLDPVGDALPTTGCLAAIRSALLAGTEVRAVLVLGSAAATRSTGPPSERVRNSTARAAPRDACEREPRHRSARHEPP
jgi:hypothetical protein